MKKDYVIGFLGTYPPKACGIATFTQDLVRTIENCFAEISPVVIAVGSDEMVYSSRVILEIQQKQRFSYKKAAQVLNYSPVDLVVLEHEYGIFGGENGEYILDFVNELKIPLITTLHTVLPKPLPKQRYILQELGEKSEKIITMAYVTKKILEEIYHIPAHKIEVVPHGVSLQVQHKSKENLKEALGYKGRQIISTFGLLSEGKGLEYGIEAVAKVAKMHPEILYLILGQTHPCVKARDGEAYREKIQNLVYQLDVEENVKFINRYLSKEEIGQYLFLSDIYMTPYPDSDQAVSGTLAYAAGYGKMIISTPYLYAQEILADQRGLFARFSDADSLAEKIEEILSNPGRKNLMAEKMAAFGEHMLWDNVAKAYVAIFQNVKASVENSSWVV